MITEIRMPRDCCDSPEPVSFEVYAKDFEEFLNGKNVEVPDPKSKLPMATVVVCDSCKEILSHV